MAADPGLPNHPGQLAKSVGAELDAILPPPSRPTGPRSPHVHILAAGRRVAGPHWRGLGSFAAALLVGLSIGSLTAHDRPPAAPAQPACERISCSACSVRWPRTYPIRRQ